MVDKNKKGTELEEKVANIYRRFGAIVKQNYPISGHEIDIYVELPNIDGIITKYAVECKDYNKKIGKDITSKCALVFDELIKFREINKGIIVSTLGYTQPAYSNAKGKGIELLTLSDLEIRLEKLNNIISDNLELSFERKTKSRIIKRDIKKHLSELQKEKKNTPLFKYFLKSKNIFEIGERIIIYCNEKNYIAFRDGIEILLELAIKIECNKYKKKIETGTKYGKEIELLVDDIEEAYAMDIIKSLPEGLENDIDSYIKLDNTIWNILSTISDCAYECFNSYLVRKNIFEVLIKYIKKSYNNRYSTLIHSCIIKLGFLIYRSISLGFEDFIIKTLKDLNQIIIQYTKDNRSIMYKHTELSINYCRIIRIISIKASEKGYLDTINLIITDLKYIMEENIKIKNSNIVWYIKQFRYIGFYTSKNLQLKQTIKCIKLLNDINNKLMNIGWEELNNFIQRELWFTCAAIKYYSPDLIDKVILILSDYKFTEEGILKSLIFNWENDYPQLEKTLKEFYNKYELVILWLSISSSNISKTKFEKTIEKIKKFEKQIQLNTYHLASKIIKNKQPIGSSALQKLLEIENNFFSNSN